MNKLFKFRIDINYLDLVGLIYTTIIKMEFENGVELYCLKFSHKKGDKNTYNRMLSVQKRNHIIILAIYTIIHY